MKKLQTRRDRIRYVCQAGIIAALYTAITFLCNVAGLASGPIQLRASEALCILPMFTPAAIPGLTVGCLISNVIGGCLWQDVLFGTLATLIGAIGARLLRRLPYLSPLPTVVANTIIVPFVLVYGYGLPGALPFFMLTVGIGEVLSCGLLGQLLYSLLDKHKNQLF